MLYYEITDAVSVRWNDEDETSVQATWADEAEDMYLRAEESWPNSARLFSDEDACMDVED